MHCISMYRWGALPLECDTWRVPPLLFMVFNFLTLSEIYGVDMRTHFVCGLSRFTFASTSGARIMRGLSPITFRTEEIFSLHSGGLHPLHYDIAEELLPRHPLVKAAMAGVRLACLHKRVVWGHLGQKCDLEKR